MRTAIATTCSARRPEIESAFEVIHAVRHPDTGDTLFVRVAVPKETPGVDSIAFVFAGAEWQEREIFDLFGVNFHGHPDLRRLLLPDEYVGTPASQELRRWTRRGATGPRPSRIRRPAP
jgi:NADH:ubiquinone oxidoreductase subunit C